WASAVEGGLGMALVVAEAAYGAQLPRSERPHRLVFLLNAGHMSGGAGVHAFIARHKDALARVVLELHLEHAANEFAERDGVLSATGHPEARWWFTSRIPRLEDAVRHPIEPPRLTPPLLLPPAAFA